jgi:hypothetical protein
MTAAQKQMVGETEMALSTQERPVAIDASVLPDLYAMICIGDCMEPTYKDGVTLLFDRVAPVSRGDTVVIWWKPEFQPLDTPPAIVKQLDMDFPFMKYPYEPHPDNDIIPSIVVSMLNPPRRFRINCERIAAIHRCLGPVVRDRRGNAMASASVIETARKGAR